MYTSARSVRSFNPVLKLLFALICAWLVLSITFSPSVQATDYAIHLKSRVIETGSRRLNTSAIAAIQIGKPTLIQFNGPLTDADRSSMESRGITFLEYIPNFTYLVRMNQQLPLAEMQGMGIRWAEELTVADKLDPRFESNDLPAFARVANDSLRLIVVLHKDIDPVQWASQSAFLLGFNLVGVEPSINAVDLVAPASLVESLAGEESVLWIEPGLPEPVEHNADCRTNLGAGTLQTAPYSLTGNGITVAMWDGGRADPNHPDFTGRVTSMDAAGISGHATHVAGTVMGSGALTLNNRGMATQASMLTQLWWNSGSEAQGEYSNVINNFDALLATNSWGYGVGSPVSLSACQGTLGNYFSVNATLDNIVRGTSGRAITIMWSAGNDRGGSSQYCGSIGMTYGTISPPGTGKNLVTVGAINSNNNSMTSFSSWGPTDDGRIKPDVVGPGCQSSGDGGVTSTYLNNSYAVLCGTSMSTPAVAGIVALMYDRHRTVFGDDNIYPSTVKGILINSAGDLGNAGPDYAYGHGKVDGVKAVDKIALGEPSYVEGTITTGVTKLYDLTVPSGATRLKVTLVWDDPGGSSISGLDLINDLDLTLIAPNSNVTQPWTLNPASPSTAATRSVDRINNVETAEVTSPTPGQWKARVVGFNIPTGPQKFSLVFTPDNIHTPGSLNAVEVVANADIETDPNQTDTARFWVRNIGASADSVRVTVSEQLNWILGGGFTATYSLGVLDSAQVLVPYAVPNGTASQVINKISCQAKSLSDSLAVSNDTLTISAGLIASVAILDLQNVDTTLSPSSLSVSVQVKNNSNGIASITTLLDNPNSWVISPASINLSMPISAETTLVFQVSVPAELAHLDNFSLSAISSIGSESADTAVSNFVIYNPVQPPTLDAPSVNSYLTDPTPTFSWLNGGDSVRLIIATDLALTNVLHSYGGLTASSFEIPLVDQLSDGLYYWGARKFVGPDSSSYQANPRLVGIDNTAPQEVTPVAPAGGIMITDTGFNFVVNPVGIVPPLVSPEYLRIRYANDSTFGSPNVLESIAGNSYAPNGTVGQGRWFWQAQRYDLAGNSSAYSATTSFLLDTDPPVTPNLITPNDSANIGSPVVLKWSSQPSTVHERTTEYSILHISTLPNFGEFSTFFGFIYGADSLLVPPGTLTPGTRYFWRVKPFDSAGFTNDYTAGRTFVYDNLICGDLDRSGSNPDIGDLTNMVDYLFITLVEPVPLSIADVNCDNSVDIGDLTILVDHLFISNVPLCCTFAAPPIKHGESTLR